MALAGWCSECNAHVWVAADGGCANGHPRSCLRAVHEASPATSTAGLQSAMPAGAAAAAAPNASARAVADAQRLVIYVFAGLLACNFLARSGSALLLLPLLAVSILGVISVWRLASALGYSTGMRALFVVSLFVPLASLIVLLVLIDRATKFLRAAGYKVGLLGARV